MICLLVKAQFALLMYQQTICHKK